MLTCIILWVFLPKTYISTIEDSLIKVYKSTKINTIKFDIADRLYTIKVRQIKFIEAKAYIDTLQVLAHKINQEQFYSSAFKLKRIIITNPIILIQPLYTKIKASKLLLK